jgi:hypothetical protein
MWQTDRRVLVARWLPTAKRQSQFNEASPDDYSRLLMSFCLPSIAGPCRA